MPCTCQMCRLDSAYYYAVFHTYRSFCQEFRACACVLLIQQHCLLDSMHLVHTALTLGRAAAPQLLSIQREH